MTVSPCPTRVPACPGHGRSARVPVSLPIGHGHGTRPEDTDQTAEACPRCDPPLNPATAHAVLAAELDQLGTRTPCQTDPDAWFAPDTATRADAADACRYCPVLGACQHYADAADEQHGVWAGVDRETTASTRPPTPEEKRS